MIEDEEGDELTPAMDAAILRTLHKIRAKQGVYSGEDVLQQELSLAQERAGNLKLAHGIRQPKEKVNRVHVILLRGNRLIRSRSPLLIITDNNFLQANRKTGL